MNVLMISTVPMEHNGIASVISNIIIATDKKKVKFDCVAIDTIDEHIKEILETNGCNIYIMKDRLKDPIGYFGQLIKLIKQKKYDCIHVHGNSHTIAIELCAAKIAGCKVRVAHSHNTSCKYIKLHKLLTPLFEATCTDRIACGKEAGKWLFKNKKFTILKNGIITRQYMFNEDTRKKIRKSLNIDEDTIILGHIGEFNVVKNQKFILNIFEEIIKIRKTELVLIGSGVDAELIKQLAKEKEIYSYIIFTGVIDNVAEYLSAIDCIIMPSLYEGFPMTLVEEQANGLSCIVSDTITRDANLTGNVVYLSLNDSKQHWVNAVIMNSLHEDRMKISRDAIRQITNMGYDIEHECNILTEFYLSK